MPEISPRIAIVDDDPSVLKALSRLLSTRALNAKTFPSGQQFLNSLAEEIPDCLILDLQMPGMTGLELRRDLERRGVQIPTIIITARNEPEMREQCASAGAIAFLPKPINDASLFAAIELASKLGTTH
jgi:FixJ family two-component response regulator